VCFLSADRDSFLLRWRAMVLVLGITSMVGSVQLSFDFVDTFDFVFVLVSIADLLVEFCPRPSFGAVGSLFFFPIPALPNADCGTDRIGENDFILQICFVSLKWSGWG